MKILNKTLSDNYSEWIEAVIEEGAAALVDKELDWTSFDVVAKLRRQVRVKKVGHAGTLDPLATGLLILCFGKATKKINEFQGMKKVYSAEIKLGAVTKSDDSEFDEENIKPTDHITKEMIVEASKDFIGEISQIPPIFSAKKVKGKRLYKYARKDEEVEIKPSIVQIDDFRLIEYIAPVAKFEVECSKGTYIRALARDLGAKLECGGYLKSLRRTAIGEYLADDALTVNEIVDIVAVYNKNREEAPED
ncbi:MAG: tRNA pseudouridine(55) synthase TruB [Candidatus Kapabacteria bacterium]|jgi:tRNA pseudouridine55 synthase|nr:tRNA pseudouridine(55) synthase TruB [Candidatus Kapabacteria bacterium]